MNGEPITIQWKRGDFRTYYALMKIRVGGATEVSINSGDEFEYDGSVLKFEGREIPQPSLRGSFRQGWVSEEPPGEEGSYVPPKQATRNIASSQSVNRNLSQVQRRGQGQIETDSLDEDTVLNVSDRSAARRADPRGQRGHLSAEHNRRHASARGMEVHQDALEAQEAVPIGRVRTSTHFKGDITKPQNAGLKDRLENLSGSGFIADENGPVMEPQRRSTGKVVDRSVHAEMDDDGVEVGRVRHSSNRRQVEGVSVRDTSGPQGPSSANPPRGANGPAGPARTAYKVNTKVNPKVRVARAIYPDFPSDWSFEGKLSDRLAAVKAHGATPEFLDALYAAEGDQMRKALAKAYPKQFA